jgi:microcystin-dependent protein
MSEQFLGEVRVFGFGSVVPKGWMVCAGQTLPISQNQALFSLLGTQFGGDGISNFKLPDLRGRAPLGISSSHPAGTSGGEEAHTLTVAEIPAHTHQVKASSTAADQSALANNYWASIMAYDARHDTTMAGNTIATAGASAPHSNMQPCLALSFCIAVQGIYPSRP